MYHPEERSNHLAGSWRMGTVSDASGMSGNADILEVAAGAGLATVVVVVVSRVMSEGKRERRRQEKDAGQDRHGEKKDHAKRPTEHQPGAKERKKKGKKGC